MEIPNFREKFRIVKNGIDKYAVQQIQLKFNEKTSVYEFVWEFVKYCNHKLLKEIREKKLDRNMYYRYELYENVWWDTLEEAQEVFDKSIKNKEESFLKENYEVVETDLEGELPTNPEYTWQYVYNLESALWAWLEVNNVSTKCALCEHFVHDDDFSACQNTSDKADNTCFGIVCPEFKLKETKNV